ncbi:cytosine permease [Mycobacterium frederiksbergense]|uniref:Cytosine permease n=1 Tax=Mycolicibacterium frederiksbergense TaxID=117567 RepID=A0ABT6KY63_9MYCO|nr:cytosine permease [Mycolicibacterium frederiksbergense]MDH6195652.1 cytosine permease [Mycolicibacterium frederiksbergense]
MRSKPSESVPPDAGHRGMGEEYETTPVPPSARRGLVANALVWMGFPMILTCAVVGGAIVSSLGFAQGVAAILVGNITLFLYTGLIGIVSTRRGLNFRLQSALTFGTKGSTGITGAMATIVVGWFAVQVALTGVSMGEAFGISVLVMSIIAGLIYTGITMLGIRALTLIGYLSIPLFLLFGIWAVIDAVSVHGWGSVTSFSGDHALTFGFAVTMVIALFVDGGTMTGDFNRWAKNTPQSLISTAAAFPFANSVSMLIGGIITAAVGSADRANFFHAFTERGGLFTVLAILLLFMNLGSVCAHNLYLSAVGWASLSRRSMRVTAAIIGIVGIGIAVSGAWSYFEQWLSLLGILVPPLGAVMIVDQLMLRRWRVSAPAGYRLHAFVSWGIGCAVSALAEAFAPALSTAVVGMVAGGLAHYLISKTIADPDAAQRAPGGSRTIDPEPDSLALET